MLDELVHFGSVYVTRFQFECTKWGGRIAYEELGDEMEHN
jgi:hypothetical protein